MQTINLVRLIAFGVVLLFSLIVMSLAANFLAQTAAATSNYGLSYTGYSYGGFFGNSVPGFAVATPILTFAILIPALVIDFMRKGAVTSLTASELGFTGFLWVLWLACASNATSAIAGLTSYCTLIDGALGGFCSQYQALQAFAWLNWLILFFYWIGLLSVAVIALNRGNKKAFMVPTTELISSVPHGGNAAGEPKIPPQNYAPGGIPTGTYPPQGQYPQQSFTPSQYPQQSFTPAPQSQMYPSQVSSPAPMPSGAIQV